MRTLIRIYELLDVIPNCVTRHASFPYVFRPGTRLISRLESIRVQTVFPIWEIGIRRNFSRTNKCACRSQRDRRALYFSDTNPVPVVKPVQPVRF